MDRYFIFLFRCHICLELQRQSAVSSLDHPNHGGLQSLLPKRYRFPLPSYVLLFVLPRTFPPLFFSALVPPVFFLWLSLRDPPSKFFRSTTMPQPPLPAWAMLGLLHLLKRALQIPSPSSPAAPAPPPSHCPVATHCSTLHLFSRVAAIVDRGQR